MIRRRTDNLSVVAPLDFLLSFGMVASAIISVTQALGSDAWNWLCPIAAVGYLFSYAMANGLQKSRWIKLDAFVYFGLAILAIKTNPNFIDEQNQTLALIVPRFLVWLMVFCSFAVWRDSALLFQAVPTVAVFGLVGIYDTFNGAVVAFFFMLLCLATMLGRAHARAMMQQAEASGIVSTENIRQTIWRWMAGPEWALISATAVVILSVISAPLLRESVKSFAGQVRVNVPLNRNASGRRGPPNLQVSTLMGSMSIGNGPKEITDDVILYAKLEGPRYLRSKSYDNYNNGTWSASSVPQGQPSFLQIVESKVAHPIEEPFSIELIRSAGGTLPVPGEIATVNTKKVERSWDGTYTLKGAVESPETTGKTITAGSNSVKDAVLDLPPDYDTLVTYTGSAKLQSLTQTVILGATTDAEKARRIYEEIIKQIKYNLDAAASPVGVDPVEYAMFTSHEAYCDIFASAMALMARSAGIPARVSVGFYPVNAEKDQKGRYVLRENEAHAWAELFFEGSGWVVYDATAGAEAVPGEEWGRANSIPWYSNKLVQYGGYPLAAILTLFGIYRGFGLIRSIRRRGPNYRRGLGKVYARFERILQKAAGKPRRLCQTPGEYLEVSKNGLGAAYEIAAQVNARFESAMYADEKVDKEKVAELAGVVAQFKKDVRR